MAKGDKAFVFWDGLDELMAEIKALPAACVGEAGKLLEGAANGAYVAIHNAYPSRSGNLRKGMRLKLRAPKGLVVTAEVKNVAKHAVVFERGSEARHYVTQNGKTHLTGRMPPAHVFGPRIAKARRALTEDLKAMVVRHGATTVTED